MKRVVKYSLYAAIVLLFTVFLSGCHSMYSVNIESEGYYMTDKTIDILIPISEKDENYIDSVIEYYDILKFTDIMKTATEVCSAITAQRIFQRVL